MPQPPAQTMGTQRSLLIVTDVDGTLLDGRGRPACTRSALHARLACIATAQAADCTFVLASSRTLSELVVLQRALGVRGACIAEDGAVLALDADAVPPVDARADRSLPWRAGRRELRRWNLGDSASRLRTELSTVIAPHELDPNDTAAMATIGFRSRGAVRRALVARGASVLLDLRGVDDCTVANVRDTAEAARAHLHRGGRWHTLTRGAGKGTALSMLRDLTMAAATGPVRIVAVGNEENDASLLASADVGFAIRNVVGGVHPALAALDGVIPLAMDGTAGFVEMLDRLVDMPLFGSVSR